MPDVLVRDEGTIVLLQPCSEEAKGWLSENTVTESWQWWGPSLCVEHRYADDIIEAMREAGLEVEHE